MGAYENMLANVPEQLRDSQYFKDLASAYGEGIDAADTGAAGVLNQLFIALADYGLAFWEEYLGLPINPAGRTNAERRERITSKIRGTGTSTVAMIEQITESYTNGEVSITEQPSLYQFTVTFVSEHGIPSQIDDLKAAIREAAPAHLAISYVYRYLIWSELDTQNLTWAQLDSKGLTWAQFEQGAWLDA